jgi:hypothetical protein
MDIWDILLPFGTFCVHLVHFSVFGIMYKEKSGNPGSNPYFKRIQSLCRHTFSFGAFYSFAICFVIKVFGRIFF